MFSYVAVQAETVYKTVDEDGNIIFTDKPSEEAEKIEIQELQTIKNPNPGQFRAPTKKENNKDTEQAMYQALSIIEPIADEGYRANGGNVSIKLSLQPELRPGHRVIIKMDGNEISNGAALSASVNNVDRGTHTITASVVNSAGKSIISTSSTFSVLRAALGGQ